MQKLCCPKILHFSNIIWLQRSIYLRINYPHNPIGIWIKKIPIYPFAWALVQNTTNPTNPKFHPSITIIQWLAMPTNPYELFIVGAWCKEFPLICNPNLMEVQQRSGMALIELTSVVGDWNLQQWQQVCFFIESRGNVGAVVGNIRWHRQQRQHLQLGAGQVIVLER